MARAQERSAKSEAIPGPAHPPINPDVQASQVRGRFRSASAADLPALAALEAQFPGDRLSARQLRHHLRSGRSTMRVLDDGANGIAGYSLSLRHAQRPAWRLYSIAVDRSRRGSGLGARLLQDVLALACLAHAPAVTLEVREDNAPAIALYRNCGFVQTARCPGYYDDGAAALCFRKALALCPA